jgi:hypothetical protein
VGDEARFFLAREPSNHALALYSGASTNVASSEKTF